MDEQFLAAAMYDYAFGKGAYEKADKTGDDVVAAIAAAQAALEAAGAMTEMLEQIAAEVARATAKFPTWPTDPLHAVAVLGEEFGELTKETLQLVYEPHKTSLADVRKEAIQTAAMALRFIASIDRYEFTAGPQHAQNSEARAALNP